MDINSKNSNRATYIEFSRTTRNQRIRELQNGFLLLHNFRNCSLIEINLLLSEGKVVRNKTRGI